MTSQKMFETPDAPSLGRGHHIQVCDMCGEMIIDPDRERVYLMMAPFGFPPPGQKQVSMDSHLACLPVTLREKLESLRAKRSM